MADRMSKLKRDIDCLEKGMQRIRMKLAKLQQDPTQILATSRVGSRPKKIIDQQDYSIDGKRVEIKKFTTLICTQAHILQ